ncbi:hypothetical protein [Cryobacterium tepidiphilum]|uniref:Uncharacterized protein n=1 Tax=Cryobacterium tepidiphilum TaxID=2486026 RepID=A0A3M8KVX0_9MICO|nr:hypothetical protein [Cryobacterium tepidiphilum]RNE56799.1 hypothetical protein EEJ31_12830 [Cryobacterium tepidiphilum]
MRWDNLFDDLEGQLEHELSAEETDLRAEDERLRVGRLSLRDRLTSLAEARDGSQLLRLVLIAGNTVTVRPVTFGKDWLAGDLVGELVRPMQCVLPLAGIAGVLLAPGHIERSLRALPESPARIVDRIGLPFVLRDLCRRRKPVEILTPAGALHGTIDRVGRDHVDLAVHPPGTLRRSCEVGQVRLVPLGQIHLVRLS